MGQLKVNFLPPQNPDPVGYRIGYRLRNSSADYTVFETSQIVSPVVINNVDSSYAYDCYIQSKFSDNGYSAKEYLLVYPPTIIYNREYYSANGSGQAVGVYDPVTGYNVRRIDANINKIAVTRSKLFVGNGANPDQITVYSITLDPWSCIQSRVITLDQSYTGLFAKNDTTLISIVAGTQANAVYSIDISGPEPVYTLLFHLPSSTGVATNGLAYNHIDDSYIVTTIDYNGNSAGVAQTITQLSAAGEVQAEAHITQAQMTQYGIFHGLFQFRDKLLAMNHAGDEFEVKQSGLTLFRAYNAAGEPYGSSVISTGQLQEYTNMNIPA